MQVGSTGSPYYASGSKKATNALNKTNQQLQTILEKLSTAQRINKASDDAAGLSISEELRSNIHGYKMASQNIQDAMAALDIADGAGQQISTMLQRQRELAISARNDTLTNTDRQSLDSEYQALTQEIERIAQATGYNGLKTSNGTDLASGSSVVQAGAEAGDQITLPKIDLTVASSAVSDSSIVTSADAQTALTAIDNVLKSLNEQRSAVGATINQFVSTGNNLSVSMVNTQAAESVVRDQDMAQGITELIRQQLLQEGGTAALGRFNAISRYQIMGIIES
jgi:flagellin